MLSIIKLKLIAFLTISISVLLMVIGYKNKKIEQQKEKIYKGEKLEEITETMEKTEIEAEKEESAKNIEYIGKNWRSKI